MPITKRTLLSKQGSNRANVLPNTAHDMTYGCPVTCQAGTERRQWRRYMGKVVERQGPAALSPGKRPSTPCMGDWVDFEVSREGSEKYPPIGIQTPTFQPVTRCYTDYAIPGTQDT